MYTSCEILERDASSVITHFFYNSKFLLCQNDIIVFRVSVLFVFYTNLHICWLGKLSCVGTLFLCCRSNVTSDNSLPVSQQSIQQGAGSFAVIFPRVYFQSNNIITNKRMTMKKCKLLLLALLFMQLAYGQVGINTTNPAGIFHVDPLRDTNGSNKIADDVVISSNGNVGIGTITPSNKLSVISSGTDSGLYLPNGASAGNVLTSDANGNASWQSGSIQFQTMVTSSYWKNISSTNTKPSGQIKDSDFTKMTTFDYILLDRVPITFGSNYGWSTKNQNYRAPTDGIYRIGFSVYFISSAVGNNCRAYIFKNNRMLFEPGIVSITDSGADQAAYVMGLVPLKKNDILDLRILGAWGGVVYWAGIGHTFLLIESL